MKKIILLSFLTLASVIIHAQMKIGLVAGVNMTTEITTFKDAASSKTNPMSNLKGLVIGPTVEMMAPSIDLGLEISTLYSKKGSNFSYQLDNPSQSYAVLLEGFRNVDYMEVPVYLKWRFGPPGFKAFITAGYYWSFAFKGLVTIEKAEDLMNNNNPIPSLVKTTEMKFGDDFSPYKSIDQGYTLGAGLQFVESLELGIYYTYGTTSFSNEKMIGDLLSDPAYPYEAGDFNISTHNSTVSLRVAYMF